MKAPIFISYSRSDEAFARELATSLANIGSTVWIDLQDIPAGMNWSSAIQEGLDQAHAMLVIISPDSMGSSNVTDEWQYFKDQDKPIIPVMLHPAKIHFQLHRLQYIDFHARDYETAFEELLIELESKGMVFGDKPAELGPLHSASHPSVMPETAPSETEPSGEFNLEIPSIRVRLNLRKIFTRAGIGLMILVLVLVGIALMLGPLNPNDGGYSSRVRPIRSGYSVAPSNTAAMTIGAFVCDDQSNRYLLGVLSAAEDSRSMLGMLAFDTFEAEATVLQPASFDGGIIRDSRIGETVALDGKPVSFNTIYLVRIDDEIRIDPIIPEVGQINDVISPEVNMRVRKVGRTTGLTRSTVITTGQTSEVVLNGDENVIQLQDAFETTRFSEGGDGGALVIDADNHPIGIIITEGDNRTVAVPLQPVLDAFKVELIRSSEDCG